MKSLRKEMIEKRNQKEHTITERQILGEVANPFIVQLRYAFQTNDKLYMVMDFANGGELFYHLRRAKSFTEDRTCFYAAEIALALEYLHSLGIIYRDLKPENVLIDGDGHIKLTDFGLSKQFAEDQMKKAFSFCGTPEYIAPEILKRTGHDHSVDFWSLGALIYEMLASSPPFYSKNKEQMFRNMLTKPVALKPHFSSAACDIIQRLLQVDPTKRLNSFAELKQHEFFASVDWEKLAHKAVPVPFKPQLTGPRDLRYFDKMFTGEEPIISVQNRPFAADGRGDRYDDFTYQSPGNV